jgi:imidazole glycerol-phosphate synthase subunit HisH
MLTIIDYGTGNLLSIKNMLKRLGIESHISNREEDINNATRLILPGVGHFDHGMRQLRASGLVAAMNKKVLDEKTPILGICLGVQLFTRGSDEGSEPGLGWVNGKTVSFDKDKMDHRHKIPNMGWADVTGYHHSKLFTDMYEEPHFYFVHSFHLELENKNEVIATARYGYDFEVGIEKGNIIGVQFHPEKSHKYGMRILENFVKYY